MKLVIFFTLVWHQALGNTKFPDDFLFGVSSAAYQIEGGHDFRGETVFDFYQRQNPSMVKDSSNAEIACDSYHHYEEDLDLLSDLGVDFYRFSISWSRILPTGYSNRINPDGIRYYNSLIDGLIKRKIQPVVTIFHYDLPKPMQDLGGWVNPILADLFTDYSKILFKNFGDRVKTWITFNANFWGCGDTYWPPMLNQSGIGEYMCAKTTLLAHAKTYHLYEEEFRKEQNGRIGFVDDGQWYEPASDSKEDQEAAERAREFRIGLLFNPIYGNGDFPEMVKKRVEELSRKEGFLRSRLPQLTEQEREYIKGTYDFLGLNIYTTVLVKDKPIENFDFCSFEKDVGVEMSYDPKWEGALSVWLKVVPWGLRNVLKWVKDKYNNPPILITENGFSDNGELDDLGRIKYHKLYLKSLLEAIHEDGVNVEGYAVWSFLDNFEWLAGYSEKFGLYHVDFNDPNRKRTPKSSAAWYKKLLERRQLDDRINDASKTEL